LKIGTHADVALLFDAPPTVRRVVRAMAGFAVYVNLVLTAFESRGFAFDGAA
jgi:hypothetical protein